MFIVKVWSVEEAALDNYRGLIKQRLYSATLPYDHVGIFRKEVSSSVCVCVCVCVGLQQSICARLFPRSVVNVICSGRESMSNSVRVRRVTKQVRVTLCPLSTHFRPPSFPWVACWVSVIMAGIFVHQGSHVGSVFLSAAALSGICNWTRTFRDKGLCFKVYSFLKHEISEEVCAEIKLMRLMESWLKSKSRDLVLPHSYIVLIFCLYKKSENAFLKSNINIRYGVHRLIWDTPASSHVSTIKGNNNCTSKPGKKPVHTRQTYYPWTNIRKKKNHNT